MDKIAEAGFLVLAVLGFVGWLGGGRNASTSRSIKLSAIVSCLFVLLPCVAIGASSRSHYERPASNRGPYKERVIVFVHGIFGNADDSWKYSTGVYWPKLLLTDDAFQDTDIYVADYESPYHGNTMTVNEVAASLNSRLESDEVFSKHREVIFVCHSLGGIVVQQLLLTNRDYATQVPLIYFFATPQTGAAVARLGSVFSSDPLLEALLPGENNHYLEGLEFDWKAAHFKTARYCAYEKKAYKGFVIVDRLSATRNCDDYVPINEDHISIVKPNDASHPSYIALRNAIKKLPSAKRTTSPKVRGYVRLSDGERLPHVQVRATNIGATTTTDSGEFIINLPGDFGPGDPVVLSVQDWIILRPYDGSRGRIVLPKATKEPIEVIVSRKGDQDLLTADQIQHIVREAISPLEVGRKTSDQIQQIVREPISPLEVGRRTSTEPIPIEPGDEFLTHTAEEIGVPVQLLKTAIDRWSSQEGFHQKGLAALSQGEYAQASAFLEKSVNSAEGDIVQEYKDLATAYHWQQAYPLAESNFRKALVLRPDDAEVRNALGATLNDEAKYTEAIELLKPLDNNASGTEAPVLAVTLNNLGFAFMGLGMNQQAESYLQRAWQIDERTFGPADPQVAIDLNNLGLLYLTTGRFKDAEDALIKARTIHIKQFGPNSRDMSLTNLASLRIAQEMYPDAIEILRKEIAIDQSTGQVSDSSAATHVGNLGSLYFELGDKESAQPLLEEALSIDTVRLGSSHPSVALDEMNLARVYMASNSYDIALLLLENAHETLGSGDRNPSDVGAVLNLLAHCYAGLHRYSEAKETLLKALSIDTAAFGSRSFASISDMNSMGEIYRNAKEYDEAVPWYREALCIEEMNGDENTVGAATIASNWSLLYFDWQKYAEAEPLLRRVLKVYVAKLGYDNWKTPAILMRLGEVLYKLGNPIEAGQLVRQAQGIHDRLSKAGAN